MNGYICHFLPEKDYGIYNLVSKNFCNQLWPQYLTRRNIKVIDGGKSQVFKSVRSFCSLFTKPCLGVQIEPKPLTIFEVKEFLKDLPLHNRDLVSTLWDFFLYSEEKVSEEMLDILMEFETHTFRSIYQLFIVPTIYADLTYETLQNFMERAVTIISSKDLINYLKIAIEKKKPIAIDRLIKIIKDFDKDTLTLALNEKIGLKNIKTILDRTNSCNYVNLLSAMAGGYEEGISLEIIKKLTLAKDTEITPNLLKEATRREFSRDMIENIRNIHAHITSLSKFKFKSLIEIHADELKKNQNSWLSKDSSKGILIKLLNQEIEWKTFYRFHEFSTLSICYAKSSGLVKEALIKKFPLAAYNFNLDQFILADFASQKNKSVVSNIQIASLDCIAGEGCIDTGRREILFFDKKRKNIVMKLNSEKITVYTSSNKFQKTFERHEKLQKEQKLPTFIATWIDPSNSKQRASEAASFINYNNNIPFYIYKSSKKENEYTYYCDQDFEENPKPMAKFNACDLTLSSDYRSLQRAYLAEYYEDQAQSFEESSVNSKDQRVENSLEDLYRAICYYQKAKFWHEKAVEDKHIDSCLTLMSWYDVGNLITKPSIKNSIMYLSIAAHAISDYEERAFQILSIYLEVLEINLSAENRETEIEYCKNRLATLK